MVVLVAVEETHSLEIHLVVLEIPRQPLHLRVTTAAVQRVAQLKDMWVQGVEVLLRLVGMQQGALVALQALVALEPHLLLQVHL